MGQYRYDFKNDGKDPYNKLMATCKVATIGAVLTGGYETIISHPSQNFSSAFVQGGKHLLKWTAVTTTFTTTVLFLTNIRKKDDPWNYFLAASASSAVFYSVTKKAQVAFGLAMFTGVGAAILKSAFLRGYDPLDMSQVSTDVYRRGLELEYSPDVRYNNEN